MRGDHVGAAESFREALEIQDALYGAGHERSAALRERLAGVAGTARPGSTAP
jgi:hypothetical protein